MHSFITNLILGEHSFKVHFDHYHAPNGPRYFVYVRDRKGDTYYFNMGKHMNEWKIVNAPIVNDLFLINEEKFSNAIVDHHNSKDRIS